MNVYEYSSNPNQRFVEIQKEELEKGEFASFSVQSMSEAMNTLSSGALKLYLYFIMNKNGYSFWLSKSHCCKVCGMSARTYFRAVDELIKKGYLSVVNNKHLFHEMPV